MTIENSWSWRNGYLPETTTPSGCNGTNAAGAYTQFTVNASAGGTATLGIRFANGGSAARAANLVVNGSTAATVSFESTGAWTTWATKTVTVPLNSASNIIRVDPTTTAGLPNLDYLDANAQNDERKAAP